MKAAGIGFREAATLASLLDALGRAGALEARRVGLPAAKAEHPAAQALAQTGREILPIAPEALAAQSTLTESAASRAAHGAGSVAEAAALAAAKSAGVAGARLKGPRAVSQDRLATAALACSGEAP